MLDSTGFVYKKGVLAATLTRARTEVRFEYLENYRSVGKEPIATSLPLTTPALVLANGATPAFFSGLLPEGRRLGAIAERAKLSVDDDLALLLEIGADLIGDVQVLAQGVSPDVLAEVLLLPRDTGLVSFSELREQYFGSRASGIPGVQDKVSSQMLNAPAKTAGQDYILKFNPKDVAFAVENEFYFLSLANQCGIKTAKFDLLTDKEGAHALRLSRFDRVNTRPNKTRLAVEDGAQVLGRYPLDKYRIDFVEMASAMINHCAAKPAAGLMFFRQLLFSWLIGNGDAHAKNFSIVQMAPEDWRASPAYDLLCTAFYEDDRTMALGIEGQDRDWTRKLLLKTASSLGVPTSLANKEIDKQLTSLAMLPDQVLNGALPFRRDQNIKASSLLKKRAKALDY
jgi:serine/threonine-protein kinase HipA